MLLAFLALSILSLPAGALSQEPDPTQAELRGLFDAYARYRRFSGAVLVARGGEVVFQGAFGLAERSFGIPNQVDTRFSIASVTKPFTAALILRLAQADKLALEDSVSQHLPEYRRDTGERITIHHLLAHTSGLPNYAGSKEFWEGNACRLDYERSDFLARLCSGDLLFAPGSSAAYSDANYYLLALIAEQASGFPFGEALRRHVLAPLGLADTGGIDRGLVIERLARGYLRSGQSYRLAAPINYEHVQLGAGNLYSTVSDLLRFERALDGEAFLRERWRKLLFTPHAASGFSGESQGYGWNLGTLTLRDSGRRFALQHAPGNNAGFAALVYRLPEAGISITLIQNAGPSYLDMQLYEICTEVAHELLGEEALRPPRSLADRVGLALWNQGIEAARAEYERSLQEAPDDLDLRGMNRLGYELLGEGRVTDAVVVFELNCGAAPDWDNGWDSLGEAYALQERIQDAIECYERALRLNPSSANARRRLQGLKSMDRR